MSPPLLDHNVNCAVSIHIGGGDCERLLSRLEAEFSIGDSGEMKFYSEGVLTVPSARIHKYSSVQFAIIVEIRRRNCLSRQWTEIQLGYKVRLWQCTFDSVLCPEAGR
jgi:hypothetical protein